MGKHATKAQMAEIVKKVAELKGQGASCDAIATAIDRTKKRVHAITAEYGITKEGTITYPRGYYESSPRERWEQSLKQKGNRP